MDLDNNQTDDEVYTSYVERANLPKNLGVYIAVKFIIAFIAVVGNLLVIVAFARNKSLQSFRNYYIVALACADLVFALVGIPASVVAAMGFQSVGLYGCLSMCSALLVTVNVSALFLLTVCVDRFWATYKPLHYRKTMSEQFACGILGACVALGGFLGLLPLFGWYNHDLKPSRGCRLRLVLDYNYLTFLYFAGVVLPSIEIICFYTYIFYVIRKRSNRTGLGNAQGETVDREKVIVHAAQGKEARAGRKLATIVAAYLICWVPINTINCVQTFCPDCAIPIPLVHVAILMRQTDAALNPFLYAYHLKNFREGMKQTLLQIVACFRINSRPTETIN